MSYRDVYEKWLSSSALSEAEKEELRSISGDEKEIESRFFAPLEFGTAGLRGTMCVGLHQMNIHVIRHATQAFAEVILAEGPEAVKRGVAVCFDCRNHSQEFARETADVMAGNGIPVRIFESLRPTPGSTAASPVSTSPPVTTPRSTTATRSTGRTAPSSPPTTPRPSPRRWRSWTSSPPSSAWTTTRRWRRA